MDRVAKISIIALFLLLFASSGFSGGLNYGSGHFGNRQIIPSNQKFNFPTTSYGHTPKHILKFYNPSKNRKNPYRFIYNPRFVSYGVDQSEKTGKVEVNVNVIEGNGAKSNKHPVKKDKPISQPHIVTLPDIDPNESNKHLKSAKRPAGLILIRGTQVSETRTATD